MPEIGAAQREVRPADFTTLGITRLTHAVAVDTLKRGIPELPARPLRTSKQGAVVPFTLIEGPAAWRGSELRRDPSQYIYHVTPEDVAELDAALAAVKATGAQTAAQILELARDDFPLPRLGPKLRELVDTQVHQRGFHMIRGIPVQKYNRVELVVIWWGIGKHIGRALPINRYGHLLNHIHSLDNKTEGQRTRAPNTNQPQNMHSDQFATDLIGLFCIAKAASGGESTFVSSVTIHNELLRRGRTDLLRALTERKFWLNETGYDDGKVGLHHADGRSRYFPVAPFVYQDGRLSVALQSTGYYSTQEEPGLPRLSELQLEALRTVQALAIDPDLSIHFLLQPGDIQLLHNTTVLHGREGFVDGTTPETKRHLIRWWLDASGTPVEQLRAQRPLACFGDRLRDPAGGWPFAQPPYSIILDSKADQDPSLVKFL